MATEPRAALGQLRSAVGDESWDASGLVTALRAADVSQGPFDDLDLEFCARLSGTLMAMRGDPDAVSVGYWMRPASVARLADETNRMTPASTITVPRGLAFHVTPSNVDTLFVYSWILSLLVGNSNIVRLSSKGSAFRDRLLGAISDVLSLDAFAPIAHRNRIVTSERNDNVSRVLSAACDLRVVWGGDATVSHFRGFPMAAHARDVVFPDRHSLAILDVPAVAGLADDALTRLASQFFVDAFTYDQGACSSPRLVVWRAGGEGEVYVEAARSRFHDAVSAVIERRGYVAETGTAINKKVVALERAAQHEGLQIEETSNEVTWVQLRDLSTYDRANCGGGLFFEVVSRDLEEDLGALVRREDQTAACFGLDGTEVERLARSLQGNGIDRFVSMGRALQFDVTWDGMDLIQEFTKRVVIDVG